MNRTLRVLAVISNQSLLAKIEALMRRRTLELNHVSSGAGALVLAGNLRYELLVIESPLPDLDIEELLAEMRALDSISVQASFLVLTRGGEPTAGLSSRGDGTIRFLDPDEDPLEIHRAISELLGVAARRSARLLVEVEIGLQDGSVRRLYQSQNLSESGILLHGGHKLELGTRVGFDLALPGGESVRGEAMVVRHTSDPEPVAGAALRFLDLGPKQLAKLRHFVYTGLLDREESPLEAAGGNG